MGRVVATKYIIILIPILQTGWEILILMFFGLFTTGFGKILTNPISSRGGRMPRGTMCQKSSIMIVPNTYDPLAALILFAKSSFGKNTVVFAMIPVL